MTEPASDRAVPDISEERISKIWANVSAHLGTPSVHARAKARRDFLLRGGLAAALVAAVLVFGWMVPRGRSGTGAVLNTRSDTLAMKLEEGSELELGRESKLTIDRADDENVSLNLDRGLVTCEVPKKKGRTFRVRAGDFEVSVVGTRFSVEHEVRPDGARVFVRVERGIVEVKRRGREGPGKRIVAGQTWTSEEKLSLPALSPRQGTPEASPLEASPAPVDAEPPASIISSHEPPKTKPVVGPAGRSARSPAEQSFEEATALRRSGQSRAAATAYERFVADFPGDPRAALAAFEKARLQMDVLGQPRAALSALELSLRLSPGAGFREDALARLVRVQGLLGQIGACQAAKQRYLREYSKGVHREAVERLCSPK